jgi:hypothetical protein
MFWRLLPSSWRIHHISCLHDWGSRRFHCAHQMECKGFTDSCTDTWTSVCPVLDPSTKRVYTLIGNCQKLRLNKQYRGTVQFEILIVVVTKSSVFWDIVPRSLLKVEHQRQYDKWQYVIDIHTHRHSLCQLMTDDGYIGGLRNSGFELDANSQLSEKIFSALVLVQVWRRLGSMYSHCIQKLYHSLAHHLNNCGYHTFWQECIIRFIMQPDVVR